MRNKGLALAVALLGAACAVKAPLAVVTPPPPAPPPDPPIAIFPQTALDLPDPQPVPPDAIPKRSVSAAPQTVAPMPTRTAPRRPVVTTRREPDAPEPTAAASPATVEKPANRATLFPVDPHLPGADAIQKRLDMLKGLRPRLASKPGNDAEKMRGRIEYFLDQADKALARKDLRQADALASRAEVLAEDLLGVR